MSSRPMVVIGSANTDMVMKVPTLPTHGETVLGQQFSIVSGGKGANQAVALARIGKRPVTFIACLGDDDFGRAALSHYHHDKIDTSRVVIEKGAHSGVACIFVADNGENAIGVSGGANGLLTPSHIDQNEELISTAAMVLLQLETPLDTIERAIDLCNKHHVPVILNPAPAKGPLDARILSKVQFLTPNETEASHLTGIQVIDLATAEKAAKRLLELGVQEVIITLGAEGAMHCTKKTCQHIKAPSVKVVDTTGAGDTFSGALATALTEGVDIKQALHFANHAAALAVTKPGAQPSIPSREEVEKFMQSSQ
jgi:ribokinase